MPLHYRSAAVVVSYLLVESLLIKAAETVITRVRVHHLSSFSNKLDRSVSTEIVRTVEATA